MGTHGASGMVITLEIKHHQLWGFSTFHSVPLPSRSPPLFTVYDPQRLSHFPDLLCSSMSIPSLHPPIYLPLISSSTSLHPITLSINLFFLSHTEHPFTPFNPSAQFALFPHPVRSAPRLFAHTNDHIRQIALITVRLECKNTEWRRLKEFLHTPRALRGSAA